MRPQNFAIVAQGPPILAFGMDSQTEVSDKYMDIPERALLSRPLTESVGEDGIWDDFCGSIDWMDCTNEFDVRHHSKFIPENQSMLLNPSNFLGAKTLGSHIRIFEKALPVKNRTLLTPQDARNIFKRRFTGLDEKPGASVFIAQQYCVSPKTVRDIWNR
jgi:hypothetical protein